METIQQQLNTLQTSVKRQRFAIIALAGIIVAGGFIAAVRPVGDATFDTITCKGWKVIDAEGKERITAFTLASGGYAGLMWFDKEGKVRITASSHANGEASVIWSDKDEKNRISAATLANGQASVDWLDKNGKLRVNAATFASGIAGMRWLDKDEQNRINAVTTPSGTVFLPTEDLNLPMKP